jgi:hypothetical protein
MWTGAKSTLVVMCVPERQLLAAMGRTEGVIDFENLKPARFHGRSKLIKLRIAGLSQHDQVSFRFYTG